MNIFDPSANSKPKKVHFALKIATAFLVAVVGYFASTFWLPNDGTSQNSVNEHGPVSIISSSNLQDGKSQSVDAQKTASTILPNSRPRPKRPILDEEDEQKVVTALRNIQEVGDKIEIANSTTVYDKKLPLQSLRIIKIIPPSEKQLASLHAKIGSGLTGLAKNSAADKQMRERGMEIVSNYAVYSKKVKLIVLSEFHDGSKSRLSEFYVDDESLVTPNGEGAYDIPLPPKGVMRFDEQFGKSDSWGARRYAHLFGAK